MSAGAPAVQASYMKNVAAILARSGAEGAAIRRADPELFEAVDQVWRTSWMPIRSNLRLVEAVRSAAGWPRGVEVISGLLFEQLDTPLWKTLVQGGIRLLGLEPAALVRWLPAAVSLVFRNCGSWTTEPNGPRSAFVLGRELPAELAGHRWWLESMGAAAGAIGRLCQVRGRSRLLEHDAAAGSVKLAFEWDPPVAAPAPAR